MIEKENVFMTMRDNLDAMLTKIDRYKEAKVKLDGNQELMARIYEQVRFFLSDFHNTDFQVAEVAERHENAMKKKKRSGTLCYDTSVVRFFVVV